MLLSSQPYLYTRGTAARCLQCFLNQPHHLAPKQRELVSKKGILRVCLLSLFFGCNIHLYFWLQSRIVKPDTVSQPRRAAEGSPVRAQHGGHLQRARGGERSSHPLLKSFWLSKSARARFQAMAAARWCCSGPHVEVSQGVGAGQRFPNCSFVAPCSSSWPQQLHSSESLLHGTTLLLGDTSGFSLLLPQERC